MTCEKCIYEHKRHIGTMNELSKTKKELQNLKFKQRRIMSYIKLRKQHYEEAVRVQPTNKRREILQFITKLYSRLSAYEKND